MYKLLLSICLIVNCLASEVFAQSCEITEVTATALPCEGNYFSAAIDLEVNNPSSDSFMLAGNGLVYGKYAYADLPITVGPLFGDDESEYEFIAWDLENGMCQQFTTLFASDCGPICSISNFDLEFVACVSNISAIVVFDFDYENPAGLTFDLFDGDGELISTYLYSSLPVTIPFFEVNGAAPIVLTVCDHTQTDCCETFILDAIDCNPDNCEIFSVVLDPDCTGANFLMNIDFGYDNPPSDSFHLTGNNLDYGTFAYTELPITVGPLNGGTEIVWEFIIKDSENASCSNTSVYGTYQCPPPCDVRTLNAMALECNGNEAYSLLLGLDIEGEGDLGFAVFSETAYYGNYLYNELPLTLPEFEGSGDFVDYVSICDSEYLQCCSTTPFEALLCAGCLIYNIEAFPLPCNDDDEIFIQINFNYQNESNEGFEVSGNGENYGEFAYEDLPILIGPFVGDGSQYFEFVITDLVNPLCFEAVELGFIDCDTICEISNLTIETGDCSGNNMFVATIDFDYQGVSGVGFDLYVNGENFGFYDYADLPLTIPEFPSNGTGTDTIKVCENNNDNCCATLIFDSPDCACRIFDLNVQYLDCTTDSSFQIVVEYFHENLPGDFVDMFFNGALLGTYNININPVTLDIPEGDGTGVLSVCANDLGSCCDQISVELMDCELPVCSIYELAVETGDCNSDSTYLLDIVFETENNTADSILVYANGELVGLYEIQPDFNRIESFPSVSTDFTTLVVCAQGDPACCDTITFQTPDCSLFGQCQILDLVAEFDECNSDSTYILHVDFNSLNLSVDSVTITANGEFLGQYKVTDDFIAIDNAPAFDSSTTTIVVCAVGEPDCCAEVQIATPDCSGFSDCHIWDLEFFIGDCSSDTTYSIHIDFNFVNLPTDSVLVYGNGNLIGQYLALNDGLTIAEFPQYGTDNTTLSVCAVESPDCCADVEFETPDCSGFSDCHIWDLEFLIGDCLSDTTYSIHIDFNFNNLPTDSVLVYGNGNLIGQYLAVNDGLTIDDFPQFESNNTTLSVCAFEAPDCCDMVEFDTPNCEGGGECHIFDLVADFGDCNGDSTYSVFIHYFSNNLPSDSVVITSDNGYSAQFEHNPDGFTIPDFPVANVQTTLITVCALGDNDCCDTYALETPDCGQGFDCEIYELFVEVGECQTDSTFLIDIVLAGNSLPSDSVDIYADGILLGTYFDHPDFIRIENLQVSDEEEMTITVCAQGDATCCASFTIETPNCSGDCVISEIAVDVFDCNSDTTFVIVVNFEYENLPGGGVDIYSGDDYLGFYTFDQIPVEVNNFPSHDSGNYTVTICESDGTECCSSFSFPGPVCGSGGCSIFNLEYTMTPCDSAGNFFFILDFDFNDVGQDGFEVAGNGNNYGNFSYDDLPIELGPFVADETVYEFVVFDSANPDCSEAIEPGEVNCFVSTTPVDYDEFFTIFNNGTIPGIYAKKDLVLSLINSSGKNVIYQLPLSADQQYELNAEPAGLYIVLLKNGQNIWPVKLVKTEN